jgi:hypothetical protein
MDNEGGVPVDVGVDCNDFYPFSFEQVRLHISTKDYRPVDYHTP